MIFIVIPVFNRKEFTRRCLKSLSSQTFKDYRIIIVDDGSSDGTFEMVTDEFPTVHVLKGDGELWWAEATNRGIGYVFANFKVEEEDYVLTLNNDLEVPATYLERLIASTTVQKRAVIGSVSVDISDPDAMNFCGISWNEFTSGYHLKAKDYHNSYLELTDSKSMIESDMLSGRGTLIPIPVFTEIGLFDSKNFPQYAADEDFSLRAKRRGWNLVIPTDVYVKSHIKETGADVNNIRFSFKVYSHLLFSIRSPLNLKIRYRWAMKNCRLKILYFLLESSRIFLSISFKTLKRSINL